MSNGKAFAVNLAPTFAPLPHVAGSSLAGAIGGSVHTAIVAATPVVLAAAAAAGAVYVTRAALAGLDTYARTELAAAASATARRGEAKAWDDTFAEVMTCNARLLSLREKAAAADDTALLPKPFVYEGQTRDEVDDACRALARDLRASEESQAKRRITAALARRRRPTEQLRTAPDAAPASPVRSTPAEPAGPTLPAADSPTTAGPFHPSPQPSGGRRPEPLDDPTPPNLRSQLEPLVEAILDESAATVSVEDYGRLAEQAEQVLQADDTRTTKTKLDGFYLAAQDAVERQERRASEAAEAARLLVGLQPLFDEPSAMTAHQRTVVAVLRDVAGERRDFDVDLRADVDDLVVPACQAAVDRATSTTIARELETLGYAVEVSTDAESTVRLVVTREQWGDAQRVDIDVRRGELNAHFSSVADNARAEAFKADWIDDVYEIQERTAERGLVSGAVWMTDDPRPPERRVRVARERRGSQSKERSIDE